MKIQQHPISHSNWPSYKRMFMFFVFKHFTLFYFIFSVYLSTFHRSSEKLLIYNIYIHKKAVFFFVVFALNNRCTYYVIVKASTFFFLIPLPTPSICPPPQRPHHFHHRCLFFTGLHWSTATIPVVNKPCI